VIIFAESERLTRRKHDNQLHLYLENLLNDDQLPLDDTLRVIFVDSYNGSTVQTPNNPVHLWSEGGETLIHKPQLARGKFADHKTEIWRCPHELAHVGSVLPFTGGFEENSLLIHIDGGASLSNCSAWHYRDDKIDYLHYSWELKPHTRRDTRLENRSVAFAIDTRF
jgi:carbamoyltransferase